MRKQLLCLVMILGLVLLSLPGRAEEELVERIKTLEGKIKKLEETKTSSENLKLFQGLKFSGFVDASYVYNDNEGTNTFGFDSLKLLTQSSRSF